MVTKIKFTGKELQDKIEANQEMIEKYLKFKFQDLVEIKAFELLLEKTNQEKEEATFEYLEYIIEHKNSMIKHYEDEIRRFNGEIYIWNQLLEEVKSND